jgi:tetratricopeptide (TPR) repeat protein
MLRGKSRLRALALALGIGSLSLGLALISVDAAGQKPAPAKGAGKAAAPAPDGGEPRFDPDNVIAISEFMDTLVKGNAKYAAKDYPGAIDLYRKAMQQNPKHPLGPYLLGEGHLAMGNLGEAEAAFKAAEELNDPKAPLVRSRVLFCVADVYERQKKWEQAKTAWQAYTEHANKLGADGGGHPASGTARIKAVDDWVKLDKSYEIVRQRIAAEKADAGPDAGKPAAKK